MTLVTETGRQEDYRHLTRAIELAQRGINSADPNPRVGCVIVRDRCVVAEGWHERAGEDHAEVVALKAAGESARGATMYVTLEPCSHHGRTPPCVEAITAAGVARLVAAMADPNPRVGGNGLARLRNAGVNVEVGLLETSARELNPGFTKRMTEGLPFVRSKVAATLDGRTATAMGESQWITGEAARRDAHRWRARSSAILTGIETVIADDPSLTVRLPPGEAAWRQPRRVVADTDLRMPLDARMLTLGGETVVFTASHDEVRVAALGAAGARIERIESGEDGLDLEGLLRRLAALEVNEVLVEAGSRLNGALLTAGLVDELVLYLAPDFLGDRARGMFELPRIAGLGDRLRLQWVDLRRVGEDLRVTARPE